MASVVDEIKEDFRDAEEVARLLRGESTDNIDIHTVTEQIETVRARRKSLLARLESLKGTQE